jgi:hypothetical protein
LHALPIAQILLRQRKIENAPALDQA